MRAGVSIADPASTWIDVDVETNRRAVVATNHPAGPDRHRRESPRRPGNHAGVREVGDSEVIHTWAELAVIGDNARVGPFTYLRPGADLGAGAKAGACGDQELLRR